MATSRLSPVAVASLGYYLTTAQAASTVPASNIAFTLATYLALYIALLSAYISVVFYLANKASNKLEDKSTATPNPINFTEYKNA